MNIWYLATPYTHPERAVMVRRAETAHELSGLLQAKYDVVAWSPIAYYHAIALRHGMRTDHEYWLEIDAAYIRAFRRVMVAQMQGWRESRGVQWEIEFAKREGLPLEYVSSTHRYAPLQFGFRPLPFDMPES